MKKVKAVKAYAGTKNGIVNTGYVRLSRSDMVDEARFFTKMNRRLGGTDKFGVWMMEVCPPDGKQLAIKLTPIPKRKAKRGARP